MYSLSRRLSLRSRLALVYGACFLLIAAVGLAATYALIAQDAGNQTPPDVPGLNAQAPSSAAKSRVIVNKGGIQLRVSVPVDPASKRYSAAQLAQIQAGALAMAKCMRAHGITGYPDTKIVRGPGGHGFSSAFPSANFNYKSAKFGAVSRTCVPYLANAIPGEAAYVKQQKRLQTIKEWANGTLAAQRRHSLHTVLIWLVVALAVMAVGAVLLGWLLAGRALRPLRTMTSKARRITEDSLHQRLATDVGQDELGELAATFDDVLARLERAFNAQRRFVANASHELRTPVTVERALLELALANPDADAHALRHVCERVLHSTKQQQQIVEALLALARTQGGTGVEATVDLAGLVQDAIMFRAQQLDTFTLATDLQPAAMIGDPALLERLISNLIENAIVHNLTEDGWITIETGSDEGSSWLRVSNSGPEVPASMISEIFEPFRRVQGERTVAATGLGLGLSIVQGIADVYNATIETRPLAGGGLRLEVRF